MTKRLVFAAAFLIILTNTWDPTTGSIDADEKFEFTRKDPGNELGITTKVIAHIHRPAKKLTETWRFNREFTPPQVIAILNSVCSKNLVNESGIKWRNCHLTEDGLSAELTYGIPEPKNKTLQYLEMSYRPFERRENGSTGKKQSCMLSIVHENPAYFLVETFSKQLSNESLPRTPEESVDVVHQHQLGTFGQEFLGIYGSAIDQDGIFNFDKDDYYERDELYECFLSIGSSESASVIEQKCPIKCKENFIGGKSDVHNEL